MVKTEISKLAIKTRKNGFFRVGLIGCGRIGYFLEEDPLRQKPASHAGAFSVHPKTMISAACDINRERLEYFGKKFSIPASSLYTNYREMLEKENLDILSIATWTDSHCQIVLNAAQSKHTKGIYCEKPIALEVKEANRMIAACKRRNIPLIVGHERRFDVNFINVKKMVEKEVFGKLKTIIAQTLSCPVPKLPVSKYSGGSLFHDGTHLFDLALYYGGPAKWAVGFDKRAFGKNHIESTAVGIVRLQNEVNMLVEGGGERDYFKFDLDLQFERGRISIGNSGISLYKSGKSRNYTGFKELRPVPYIQPKNWENSFVGGIKELIRAMNNGHKPVSSGEEARDSLELILALYKSASRGGKKVYLPQRRKV